MMSLPRIILPVLLAVTVSAQSASVPSPVKETLAAPHSEHAADDETLEYTIEWRLITAGSAKLKWYPSPVVKAGREASLHLESTGVVSHLFKVTDDYSSQMSSELCATSSFMTAREGKRSRDTKVTFDAAQKRAFYLEKDLKTNQTIKKDVEIPPCVHDLIGGLYDLRKMNIEPGKSVQIPVSNGKKTAYLKVQCEGRETIKVPAGVRKTMRYEVFAFDNQLYNRSGHLHVWFSDDAEKTPVQFEIRLQFAIGTITLKLSKETRG
jgi:uncharacterized cupredoxin-like copper-binding protein